MTLDDRMKEVFADAFDVTPDDISEDMTIENTKAWDSLRSITLSFSLEQAFGVEFSDSELLTMESFETIRHVLLSKGVS